MGFVYAAMQMCLMSFLVVYLTEALGYPLVTAGLALTTANVGGIIGRIAWDAVADHWLPPRRLLGVIGIASAACAFATVAFSPAWSLAALLMVAACFGATGSAETVCSYPKSPAAPLRAKRAPSLARRASSRSEGSCQGRPRSRCWQPSPTATGPDSWSSASPAWFAEARCCAGSKRPTGQTWRVRKTALVLRRDLFAWSPGAEALSMTP